MRHALPAYRTARDLAITITLGAATLAGIAYRVSRLTSLTDALIMIGTVLVFAGTFLAGARARGVELRSRAKAADQLAAARRYNELAAARAEREADRLRAENEKLRAQAAVWDEEADREMWDEARRNRVDGPTVAFNDVVRPLIRRSTDRAS